MIEEKELVEMIDRLEADALQRWIDLDWVRPQRDGRQFSFRCVGRGSHPSHMRASLRAADRGRQHVRGVVAHGSALSHAPLPAFCLSRGRGAAGGGSRANRNFP